MESKNPALNETTLARLRQTDVWSDTSAMTLNGTINKVGILVTLTVASAAWSWSMAETSFGRSLAGVSVLANIVLMLALMFNQRRAPLLAPIYAVTQGLGLGLIAYILDRQTHGIAVQAFTATFAVLFAMLGLYRFNILRASDTLRRVMGVAMPAIALTYLLDLGMSFFGTRVPMIHESTPIGIGFSLFVIGMAALNFIIDFDMVERAVAARAPKWMEWYAGFAMLVTIVWLYMEILRLLAKKR